MQKQYNPCPNLRLPTGPPVWASPQHGERKFKTERGREREREVLGTSRTNTSHVPEQTLIAVLVVVIGNPALRHFPLCECNAAIIGSKTENDRKANEKQR